MKTVLVLDRLPAMRLALRGVLEPTHAHIKEATTAAQAFASLDIDRPDALFMEDAPIGMSAEDFIAKVREAHPMLPIVVMSAGNPIDERGPFLKMGVHSYIPKPFQNSDLFSVAEKLLSRGEPASLPAFSTERSGGGAGIPDDPRERDSNPRGTRWITVGTLAFAAAAAAWAGFQRIDLARHHHYPVPFSNPADLAWDNGKLWVLDWMTQTIYINRVTQTSLEIEKAIHLPVAHVSGMALGDHCLYTSDAWSKRIRRHRLDGTFAVTAEFPSPDPSPGNLFWDGKYLWVTDTQEHRIYQLETQKFFVVTTYPTPGRAPAGFFKDDHFAWSLDAGTRQLYQHRLDKSLSVLAAYTLPEFQEGGEPLSCFTWRGDTLWFAHDRKPFISRATRASLVARYKSGALASTTKQPLQFIY